MGLLEHLPDHINHGSADIVVVHRTGRLSRPRPPLCRSEDMKGSRSLLANKYSRTAAEMLYFFSFSELFGASAAVRMSKAPVASCSSSLALGAPSRSLFLSRVPSPTNSQPLSIVSAPSAEDLRLEERTGAQEVPSPTTAAASKSPLEGEAGPPRATDVRPVDSLAAYDVLNASLASS